METIENLFARESIRNYFVPRIEKQTKAFFSAKKEVIQKYIPSDFIKHLNANILQSIYFDPELSDQTRSIYESIWNTLIAQESTQKELTQLFALEQGKALNRVHDEAKGIHQEA